MASLRGAFHYHVGDSEGWGQEGSAFVFNRGQRMLAMKANAGSTNQRAERPPRRRGHKVASGGLVLLKIHGRSVTPLYGWTTYEEVDKTRRSLSLTVWTKGNQMIWPLSYVDRWQRLPLGRGGNTRGLWSCVRPSWTSPTTTAKEENLMTVP